MGVIEDAPKRASSEVRVSTSLSFNFVNQVFPLDSQNPGNTVGRIEDVQENAISEVRPSASQVSSGSVVPQEKLKLAFKLLGVSSRVSRVLEYRSSSVY